MSTAYIPNKEEKIAGTVVLVKANSNESLELWHQYAKDSSNCECKCCTKGKRFFWTQISPGLGEIVGKVDNRPVYIILFWARIDGYLVGFWNATSEIVDYAIVNNWLTKTFPNVPMVNAMNFHNAIRVIERLKEKNI